MNNKIKVLLVEDSEEICNLLQFVFEAKGFEVDSARDGVEATDKALEKFDAIILDLQMPNMDGKQFLHVLREEKDLSIPVIMFTSHERDGLEEELLEAGAQKGIIKPAKAEILIKAVSDCLASKK